jgi:DNA-binding transcriptional MerR regulator
MADERYAIGELAELGGVSRRTVRYYVQERLLPPPLGVGRGNHYGAEHLSRLHQVKALQEQGRSLDEIRRTLETGAAAPSAPPITAPRAVWRRIPLAPGVELHVSSEAGLTSPGRLQRLAHWCRRFLAGEVTEDTDADADTEF